MPYVDPEFVVPTIPEDEMYEGTEVDENVLAGRYTLKLLLLQRSQPTEPYKLFRPARGSSGSRHTGPASGL